MSICVDVYASPITGVIPNNHEFEAELNAESDEAINLIKAHRKHRKAVRKGLAGKAVKKMAKVQEASAEFERSNPTLSDRAYVINALLEY